MSSSIMAGVLAAAGETHSGMTEVELPVPAIWFGVATFAVFLLLLAITYSFKNVAARR